MVVEVYTPPSNYWWLIMSLAAASFCSEDWLVVWQPEILLSFFSNDIEILSEACFCGNLISFPSLVSMSTPAAASSPAIEPDGFWLGSSWPSGAKLWAPLMSFCCYPTTWESDNPGVCCIKVLVAPLSTSFIWNKWFSRRVGLGLSWMNAFKFSNVTITIVRLSRERSIAAYLMIASAIAPLTWWTVFGVSNPYLISFDLIELIVSQQVSRTCWLLSLSKIPSQPSTMKSWKSCRTVNCEISG